MNEIETARALANRPGFLPGASDWSLARRLLLKLIDRVEIAEAAMDRAGQEVVRLDSLHRQAARDAEHFENMKSCYEQMWKILTDRAGTQSAGDLESCLIEFKSLAHLARRLDLPGEGNPLTERFELYIARLILERDDAQARLARLTLDEVSV